MLLFPFLLVFSSLGNVVQKLLIPTTESLLWAIVPTVTLLTVHSVELFLLRSFPILLKQLFTSSSLQGISYRGQLQPVFLSLSFLTKHLATETYPFRFKIIHSFVVVSSTFDFCTSFMAILHGLEWAFLRLSWQVLYTTACRPQWTWLNLEWQCLLNRWALRLCCHPSTWRAPACRITSYKHMKRKATIQKYYFHRNKCKPANPFLMYWVYMH